MNKPAILTLHTLIILLIETQAKQKETDEQACYLDNMRRHNLDNINTRQTKWDEINRPVILTLHISWSNK